MSKVQTVAKPKAAKKAKAAPVAPKTATVAPVAVAPVSVPVAPVASSKGLYWLQMTPGGNVLRAYFVALITLQIGKLTADKPFRLWPGINCGGHLATGRLARDGKLFKLTAQGVNYFTDPKQAPDDAAVTKWAEVIRTGQAPQGYGKMSQFGE